MTVGDILAEPITAQGGGRRDALGRVRELAAQARRREERQRASAAEGEAADPSSNQDPAPAADAGRQPQSTL